MTREYYLKHKEELANNNWVPFEKMDLHLKNAFENAPRDQIEELDAEGRWYSKSGSTRFWPAMVYRINPNWTGPTEPAKPTFIDVKPHVGRDGDLLVKDPKHGERSLHKMVIGDGCIGFSYGGILYNRLQYEPLDDGESRIGFKLLTPDFVRFQV